MSRTRRAVLAVAGGLLAIPGLGGCSSDSAGTDTNPPETATTSAVPPSGSPSGDVCADVDRAQASLQAMVDTDVVREGTDTLRARFATFESDVRALLESGRSELAPAAAAVSDAIAGVKTRLAGLKDQPTGSDLARLKTDLQSLKSSTEDLITAVEDIC
ncbi:MAG TPA: hypothetical protein VFT70_11670 [Nocardioides sp.]|nr:hypothetical protein [Nocardioides sp.]